MKGEAKKPLRPFAVNKFFCEAIIDGTRYKLFHFREPTVALEIANRDLTTDRWFRDLDPSDCFHDSYEDGGKIVLVTEMDEKEFQFCSMTPHVEIKRVEKRKGRKRRVVVFKEPIPAIAMKLSSIPMEPLLNWCMLSIKKRSPVPTTTTVSQIQFTRFMLVVRDRLLLGIASMVARGVVHSKLGSRSVELNATRGVLKIKDVGFSFRSREPIADVIDDPKEFRYPLETVALCKGRKSSFLSEDDFDIGKGVWRSTRDLGPTSTLAFIRDAKIYDPLFDKEAVEAIQAEYLATFSSEDARCRLWTQQVDLYSIACVLACLNVRVEVFSLEEFENVTDFVFRLRLLLCACLHVNPLLRPSVFELAECLGILLKKHRLISFELESDPSVRMTTTMRELFTIRRDRMLKRIMSAKPRKDVPIFDTERFVYTRNPQFYSDATDFFNVFGLDECRKKKSLETKPSHHDSFFFRFDVR